MKTLFILKHFREFIPIPLPCPIIYLAVIFQDEPKGSSQTSEGWCVCDYGYEQVMLPNLLSSWLANLPTCWLKLPQHLSALNTFWALKCHTKIQVISYSSHWSPCYCFPEWFSNVWRFHLQLCASPFGSPVHLKVRQLSFIQNLELLQGNESHLYWLGWGVQSPAWKN